ncbi:MAG TPA: TIGR03118 family protein [Actinomycetota bacterium]|jgi:uncharacterized protein (TIGR03118 family)
MLKGKPSRWLLAAPLAIALLAAGAAAGNAAAANIYTVTNLVSDVPGEAMHVDPNLVNAWGLAAGPTTPWWVADNGTDVSTLYTGDGDALPLVVQVEGAPTGLVFNGGPNFIVSDGAGNSGPSRFMFSTESGTIRGWNPNVPPPPPSTQTFVVVDRSDVEAIYKGLAIASTADGDFIYATDFHNARVDVFDGDFNLVTAPGAFADPRIPHGFAPFGIQNIGDQIFVTYAKQDAEGEDDVAGPGLGFVDVFDTSGAFLGRVATRGQLNAPWGLALAPASFGRFAGDLLVGNFGNGEINAFERRADGTFGYRGKLRGADGEAISIDGLWALGFGNGAAAGPTDTLFFTAGPDDEEHGLFGKIEAG